MKTTKRILTLGITFFLSCTSTFAQTNVKPAKVAHAEPLYQDLVRDLGARKGEKEFNIGLGFSSKKDFRENRYLAEYEFAPINRLGLEIETDFSFFSPKSNSTQEKIPGNRLDGIRFSAQYTFFVSEKIKTSMALGYTQILEVTDFKNYRKDKLLTGLVYSPFFVAAKKWGSNIHTLVYAYPLIQQHFGESGTAVDWQINTSAMYSLTNSGHFIGMEVNQEIIAGQMSVTLRPQIKIKLNSHLAVGIVTGIPLASRCENLSSFFRLIIEP